MAIIVLNWNGWRDTIECISSILDLEYEHYTLIVWDNGSSDSSVERIEDFISESGVPHSIYEELNGNSRLSNSPVIREVSSSLRSGVDDDTTSSKHTARIHVVRGMVNRGFAGGCNAGIDIAVRLVNPDYFLLLNNDTVVRRDFLGHLVAAAARPHVGIVGPTLLYYDMNGCNDVVWGRGGIVDFRKYPFLRHLDNSLRLSSTTSDEVIECDWVSGAALMFSSSVAVKRLDSTFFFGNEDVDFCMANKRKGWKTCVVYRSIVWHKSGRSRSKRYTSKVAESFEYLRQNMKLYGKHQKSRYLLLPLITLQFILLTVRTTLQDFASAFPRSDA